MILDPRGKKIITNSSKFLGHLQVPLIENAIEVARKSQWEKY
jgi:hypothetical protein